VEEASAVAARVAAAAVEVDSVVAALAEVRREVAEVASGPRVLFGKCDNCSSFPSYL